jgi:3D (Asp-Asp-Asp) domain-containing protein
MRYGSAYPLLIGLLVMGPSVGCSSEQHLTVRATAFISTRTDARARKTACGHQLRQGDRVIAVSRDLTKRGLVCGTEIQIEGLEGSWTVVDVTAARHRKLIDIYMGRDLKAARQWGVQKVDIRWRE